MSFPFSRQERAAAMKLLRKAGVTIRDRRSESSSRRGSGQRAREMKSPRSSACDAALLWLCCRRGRKLWRTRWTARDPALITRISGQEGQRYSFSSFCAMKACLLRSCAMVSCGASFWDSSASKRAGLVEPALWSSWKARPSPLFRSLRSKGPWQNRSSPWPDL